MPYKQSQWDGHLVIDGVDCGYWSVVEGGGKTSDSSTYSDYDGDVQLGGKASREDITLRRLYREAVHDKFHFFDRKVSTGRCTITRSPKGDDGISWGRPIVTTGVLGGVMPPNIDKGSSDGGEIELTVQTDTELAST